jgi:sulfate adenylyltransferase large subunit
MSEDTLKFVIVGHVDHGKSTLIGRLLYDTGSLPDGKIEEIKKFCESLGKDIEFGYIMDNLEEERDQGITIDTAQIFFKTGRRDYVIIDAPGHVEFLKNMITGASQADAGILIVDAQEGVKEQTKRHAYLLSLLGIDQVITVINKMDLIAYEQERYEAIRKELASFMANIHINPLNTIPISAKQGDLIVNRNSHMEWYTGPTLLEALDGLKTEESDDGKPLRFMVQDVYSFDKRIVVGRVESGTLKTGSLIKVLPSGEETRIKSLEEYGKTPTAAETGKSIGFTTEDKLFIDRGYVIADDSPPAVTNTINANIFWMDKTPITKGKSLYLRCGTQEVPCTIQKINKVIDSSTLEVVGINAAEVKNREVAEVLIKTEKPLIVDPFNKVKATGRLVLSGDNAMAGGIITGVDP